jgi:hypothetical protein
LSAGSGSTNDNTDRGATSKGLGNLIIGYDEPAPDLGGTDRYGSHNLVIGRRHRFTRLAFGGLVAGEENTISNEGASVSGGNGNTASGQLASVSGGGGNTASAQFASISGGLGNTVSGQGSSITGGNGNTVSEVTAVVLGGNFNIASQSSSVVVGGFKNIASGDSSIVLGGSRNTAGGSIGIGNAVVLGGTDVVNKNPNSIAPQPPFP